MHNHNYENGLGPDHIHDEENGCFPNNIDKYADLIINRAQEKNPLIEQISFVDTLYDIQDLTEDQIKTLIIYSCFKTAVTTWKDGELKNIASYVAWQLKECGKDEPLSQNFINSIFNFNAVYRPLYDLLALAVESTYNGKKKSLDYVDGIIDSIIALRRFETYSGFGDFNWEKEYNTSFG